MKNILVTGSSGFIGNSTCKKLAKNMGYKIYKLKRKSDSQDTENEIVVDLSKPLDTQLKTYSFDAIIHLAAKFRSKSYDEPRHTVWPESCRRP